MKLYCFLLLIILLCLLYDNNLYEGNNGEYDTSQDRTMGYVASGDDETGELGFLEQLGITEYIPELPDSMKLGGDCKQYKDNQCYEGIGTHLSSDDWSYGDESGGQGEIKQKCMDCLKCKNRGAFVDEFYARMCDAFAGCYGNHSDYDGESFPTLPFVYAYNNTYGESEPNSCKDKSTLTGTQVSTCTGLSDNTSLDMMLLPQKAESATCHTEIATLSLL